MKKIRSKFLTAVVLIIGIAVMFPVTNAFASTSGSTPVNVAHRGASGQAPENTLAAFDKAIEFNADYFELDVQMTKDGKLILMHDTTVDRTTDGTGAIKDLTFEEIRRLDAGSWFDQSFAGETVPTLGEALDRYKGKIGILIELKNPELYPGIEQKVADELLKRNMGTTDNSDIIVQSFNWESIKQFHEILPSVSTGVLISNAQTIEGKITNEQLTSFQTYADYANPNKGLLDQDTVDRIHQHKLKTWPYTVTDREWAVRLTEWGVDGIITDYPILINMPASATTIKTLVERFEGKELSSTEAHSLKVHLTAVTQYEEKGLHEKVIKHMNGFNTLLNQQKENGLISDRAFNVLLDEATFLIGKW
ncbi:glycerophosphodiester phosphodiesterase [Virgibacillus dakarensis]|uniref:glycerophosphodiester phosphodiesterase n=1 Tax=Virgibacillus dakarensis TaxID=1917889 RepID=UPI000B447F44|nr:glycerophosphodiester phosphodiesterase family protein [Virgibacillus dakarensis]